MRSFASILCSIVLLSCRVGGAETSPTPAPAVQLHDIAPPAGRSAIGPSLATAPDGAIWLSWLETDEAGKVAMLRFTSLDRETSSWSPARTVAQGDNWFVSHANFPALALGPQGQAAAVWFVNNPTDPSAPPAHGHHGAGYHALISRTNDAGATWTAGMPLTRESDTVEFVSLAALADGGVLAAWLDGRAKKKVGSAQQLYGRLLGSNQRDTLIDPSVCDCCHTTLTAFPDGSALLAYRGRTTEEVRDIRTARFRDHEWHEPRILNHDDWRINACPVNGPQLASEGGRVAAVWFTAAERPQVRASFSPDAGNRFLAPLAVDIGQPLGRVDTVILKDGAVIATWVEKDGSLWLRRISPEFSPGDPLVLLRGSEAARVKGFPRLALLQDYAGGRSSAEILVAYSVEGLDSGVRTLRVVLPEGAWLEAERKCDCAPRPEELRGHAFRGTIMRLVPERGGLEVKHPEIPGVLAAGSREVHVAPAELENARPGREFLGRIEPRGNDWWLFAVRFVATPNPP